MLPFRWGLVSVALLIAFTHGSAINSEVNDGFIEHIRKTRRSKRSYKHGQTQSQYLNFGQPELDGKAEAEATEGGSRSTVSGAHGMGQAQSQFSSGDCSGCGVGSPVYEYSTGSPDPLTLGNVITYSDGKPPSIIGLPGTTQVGPLGPGVGTGNTYSPGTNIPFAPGTGSVGQTGKPGVYAPDSGYIPGVGGTGQTVRPGAGSPYAPGGTYSPGPGGGGQIGRPGTGSLYDPGTSGVGKTGRPGTDGTYAPGSPYFPGTGVGEQGGRPGTHSSYAPGTGGRGQISKPGADGTYAPGSTYSPGTGGGAQIARPGTDGTYAPGSTYPPGGDSGGQVGRPGSGSSYAPGGGQIGSPGTDGGYIPGSTYSPGTGGGGQIARPGTDGTYAPGSAYPPGAGSGGQGGRPGSGSSYAPGGGQTGRPGTHGGYIPGSTYSPGIGGVGQVGRPGTGSPYAPGAGSGGQIGGPAGYIPGSTYSAGASDGGQVGRPGTGSSYTPGSVGGGEIGRPRADGGYIPGSPYSPGGGGGGQIGRPGTGSPYAPGTGGGGQIGQPGAQFGPSYGPAIGSGAAPQQGPTGTGKTAIGGIRQEGQERPQLLPPPVQPGNVQVGQQPGFGSQVPTYGHGTGQQVPTYTPSVGYIQPGVGKQQVPQYGSPTSYGQPGQQGVAPQLPGQHVTQPGSFYQPSTGFVPAQQQVPQYGTNQHITGYPQQPGYAPGYPGTPTGEAGRQPSGAVQPGAQYPSTGPQQFVQPPGPEVFTRPGAGGYGQEGTVIQSGAEGGYQPGVVSGQTGGGLQNVRPSPGGGVIQPGTGFDQPGAGVQQGHFQPDAFGQPGYDKQGRVQPGGIQTRPGFGQPGTTSFGQQEPGIQPSMDHVQPGTVYTQPGVTYVQPGMGTSIPRDTRVGQQGGVQTGSGFNQGGVGYQTGVKPGTGVQQTPVYTPGYGQAGTSTGGGYLPAPSYGQPTSVSQDGIRPGGQPLQPGAGTQSGLQRPGQPGAGVQPGTSYRQQFDSQPGAGQQTGPQPGAGFGQYPQIGYPQPGTGFVPLPVGGAQQGPGAQGSGYGTGYNTIYNQQPAVQTGPGYGQPSTSNQYGRPGYGSHETGPQPGGELRQPGIQTGYAQPSGPGVTQYGHGPQQITQPGSTYIPGSVQPSISGTGGVAAGADDAFSQAESSLGNGQAAANAQGKSNGGTAKTQVQGTYSSSGSFSASAMTSDSDRSASAQVTGGAEGAMSQSQGQGGAAQSQAQVQVNEKTGDTKASSQSGGIIHQSQSEVQANDKGGLADAQSSGPGQTSSQAQIGFRPGQDGEIVRSTGGGQASAQSGVHSGNSQSQIQGTSKFGISYHGAAQSASGTKEQVATYREQNRNLFNTISQFGNTDAVTDRLDSVYTSGITSESDISGVQLKASKTNKEVNNSNKLDDDSILPDEDEEEEPYDEYEDEEDYYNENPIKMESKSDRSKKLDSSSLYRTHTQTSPTQSQQVAVADPTKKYNVVQNQNGRVQTYSSRTTTETVPSGFRGTVNVEKKFHTKSLEPHKSENKLNITADEKPDHKPRTPDSFVTVTKSITGSMDNSKNPPQDNKNFQSTYYTKSSTCGYFTFSCNIVYGANGRSKICRPKAPSNGKC